MINNLILCLKVEEKRFSNFFKSIEIEGEIYMPTSFISFKNINNGLSSVLVEISNDFKEIFNLNGKKITLFYYLDNKKLNEKKMIISKITRENQSIFIQCNPISILLSKEKVKLFSANCRANFGSSECGIKVENFLIKGEITAFLQEKNQIYDKNLKIIDNKIYKSGKIQIENEFFLISDIKNYFITLFLREKFDFQSGMRYNLIPGCDKEIKTCGKIWKNAKNFRGEPFIYDKIYTSNF